MKANLLPAALLLTTALVATPAVAADCAALAGLNLFGVDIATAEEQVAQTLPPDPMSAMTGGSPHPVEVAAHCLVEGKIDDRDGVNGRYGIRFQMRLPDEWNGRFLFQGGGGSDGFIAPATGSVPTLGTTATPALRRGYAVVSMDGGHDGLDASFAHDQQARLDLAYAAIGKVTRTAKALIRARYDTSPAQSFFMGCSNGGREAMMAAQRFPTEFDGIVAGNPGFRLSRAAVAQAWDVAQLMPVAPGGDLPQALTQADLDIVSAEVLAQCDARDGLEDGIVAAPCAFDSGTLDGRIAAGKLAALRAVMNGPTGADGRALYSDWPWDPGLSSPGWRAWKLGTAEVPSLALSLGRPSLMTLFMTPPQDTFPAAPDFDALARNVSSVGGYFDADETFLSTFAHDGGKLVIFQGMADPVFSANDIARWYEETVANTGPDVARLFMVPGMTHCGGGPAFEDFDPLTALEHWIDSGEAPDMMAASAPSMPGRGMPLCAYPAHAQYTGGDPALADSFACVTP
ncbi:tannase/feruloyl esterase family alpha/beta hydrolase [Pseudodonghicola flavimaris]|uniref:Tannase/feruloyl esterase family alpha/beta hydrolase n=1 Tax=Pseudodonghicola flavimaris TaxID=3050036 RepID=A0ABT7F2H8_9RHOB|nr:tannase/feruloyl esterase family alpha/beta hydrolase [Pseudodonghicola flavimaris]MDK3018798.1 tannase/feruloyl esterase family alpha/beta hydrolase [Pseudodonghicola flavimaris]